MEPDQQRGASGPVALGTLVLVALVLLPAVLRGGWALDDRELLFDNPIANGSLPWSSAFGRDYFHHLSDSGQWRPLASLSWRFDYRCFGDWVTGYHLSNWAMHLGVVTLAFGLLRELRLETRAALFGLIVFALHPALSDSVVWISGRTSMLSALFPLAGVYASERWRRQGAGPVRATLPAAFGLFAGLLCKEDALVFAVLIPLLAWRHSRSQARSALIAVAVTLALWCLGRSLALGAALPSAASPALGSAPLALRLACGGAAIVEATKLAILPVDYPPQYRLDFLFSRTAPLPIGLVSAWGWMWLAIPLVLLARRRPWTPSLAGLGLAALAFLPVTQIVPSGEVFAPRFLYLPLLFAVPFVGTTLVELIPRRSQAALGLALIAGLGFLSYERAKVYTGRAAWRAEVLKHMPKDVPSLNDVALLLEESGQVERASEVWKYAIRLDPAYSRTWSNLGRVQLELGQFDLAVGSLKRAVREGPTNPIPRVNLASLLMKLDRFEEAVLWYGEATRLSPGLSHAWRGLAMAHLELRQVAGARSAIERALALDPENRSAQTVLRRLESLEAELDQ